MNFTLSAFTVAFTLMGRSSTYDSFLLKDYNFQLPLQATDLISIPIRDHIPSSL